MLHATLRHTCLRQGSRPLNRRPRLPRRLRILVAGPGVARGVLRSEVAQGHLPALLSSSWASSATFFAVASQAVLDPSPQGFEAQMPVSINTFRIAGEQSVEKAVWLNNTSSRAVRFWVNPSVLVAQPSCETAASKPLLPTQILRALCSPCEPLLQAIVETCKHRHHVSQCVAWCAHV